MTQKKTYKISAEFLNFMFNMPFSNQWKAAHVVSHELMVLDREKLLVQVSATNF